jgi:tetratricopeptide (TPR) repeat protein
LDRAEPAEELDDARVRDYLAVLTEAEDDGRAPAKRRRTALPRPRTQAPPESAPRVTPEPAAEAELAAQRAAAARRPLEAEAAALYDRGIAAYALGRNDEARSLWKAAVEADPEHAMARRALRHVEGLPEKAAR